MRTARVHLDKKYIDVLNFKDVIVRPTTGLLQVNKAVGEVIFAPGTWLAVETFTDRSDKSQWHG